MRIGYADRRFSSVFLLVTLSIVFLLAIGVYRELPATGWRLGYFLAVYLVAGLLYANLGVWFHEQLHCLAFRGTTHQSQTRITFQRKYILGLSGYYQVRGGISYRIMKRVLLAPILLSLSLAIIGWAGSLILPGWWFPLLLSIAVLGILDMIHDFYMVSRIRSIGEKGKYWDRGPVIEVVWKEQAGIGD
jgi:hypothetical protein